VSNENRENELGDSLTELGKTIDESVRRFSARIATLEHDLNGWKRLVYQVREAMKAPETEPFSDVVRRIATLGEDLSAARDELNRVRQEAADLAEALARKQRCIDEACDFVTRWCTREMNTHEVLTILRPESTPPAAAEEPKETIADPLQVEWTDEGFRITAMPEKWRGDFDECFGGFRVASACTPLWTGQTLWLWGTDLDDDKLVLAQASDRPIVDSVVASVNAKHRKATPTIETVAEYLKSGEPGRSSSPCHGLIDAIRSLHAEVECRIEHGAASGGHLEYVRCKLADMMRKADIREVDLTSPVSNPSETPKSSAEVPGANPAVTLAFKKSLSEASAIVAEWPAWKRDILKGVRETLESVPDEPATNPAKVAESDGTKALRLVARLAECLRAVYGEGCTASVLSAIASEARGGGE
jgi:hypothetical protein